MRQKKKNLGSVNLIDKVPNHFSPSGFFQQKLTQVPPGKFGKGEMKPICVFADLGKEAVTVAWEEVSRIYFANEPLSSGGFLEATTDGQLGVLHKQRIRSSSMREE
jgi:hypothetical protein